MKHEEYVFCHIKTDLISKDGIVISEMMGQVESQALRYTPRKIPEGKCRQGFRAYGKMNHLIR